MSVNLYRLYAVQSFNSEKVAVYVDEGNYPDAVILSGADDIISGTRTRQEVIKYDPWVFERNPYNLVRLTYYTRILKRSNEIIAANDNVDKAIFVSDTNKKNWRGEHTLYENKVFDSIKCDTPEFTGCKPIGTITI